MKKGQRKDIFQYTAFTFILSWICWGILIVSSMRAFGSWYSTALYVLGAASPAAVALILPIFRASGERNGYYKQFFCFRLPLKHYLFPVVAAVLMFILPYALMFIINKDAAMSLTIQPLYIIFPLFANMIIKGGIEEFGWRGIIVRNMQKYNPALISIGVGSLWAVWHIPLFFIQGTGQYQSNYLSFFILTIAASFVVTALYQKSQSVIPCIIFHALFNAVGGLGFMYGKEQFLESLINSVVMLAVGVTFFSIINQMGKKINLQNGTAEKTRSENL